MKMKEADHADEKKVRIGAKPKISSILSLIFAVMMLGSGSPGLMGLGAVFGGISLIVIFAVRDEIKAETSPACFSIIKRGKFYAM